ncbi:hypothetical protein [Chryseobacterium indoltheticum]|uniref:hypothetical protein n=1 Tax=Chryseobacterium indoltheticum TaxID=254 RepID=UPI000F4E5C70|nr:hypothetical protein [Chryseobacterium indoltheticum]
MARIGGIFCDEKQALGFMLVDRSIKFDPATFSKTILDGFIAQDKIIGTVKDFNAEDADVDPGFTDMSNGERIQNTIGMKRWNLTFYRGNCFQNQIQKLNRSERYGIMFVLEDGSVLGREMKDGTVKGFDVKLFTGVKKIKTAAEGGGSSLMIDLTRTAMSPWQATSILMQDDEVDFLEVNPVAALDIKVPILTVGATTTVVNVSNMCADSVVSGLNEPDNWKMVDNDVLKAITAVSEINGAYTLTHPALVVDHLVSFKTDNAGYPVVAIDTNYYAGESMKKTVV